LFVLDPFLLVVYSLMRGLVTQQRVYEVIRKPVPAAFLS
jgi:hypothetical protein